MSDTIASPTATRNASTERISTTVIRAVADATNTEPVDLPPLYYAIDPDALDRLFRPSGTGAEAKIDRLTFTMAECDVAIDGSGRVAVTEVEPTVESGFDE